MVKLMPRLLHVTRNLPPLLGGMERLNWHMADELAHSYQVHIVGPSGAAALAPWGSVLNEVPLRPLWYFLLQATWRASKTAWLWRPDVVLAGSGLTSPIAWLAAKLSGAQAVAYLHGLDITVEHRLYRLFWLPAIRRMDKIIVNSTATRRLAIQRGVPESRITLVPPGVALPTGEACADGAADFRATYGVGSGPILLSVGRLTERKGLREFVRDVFPLVAAKHPEVQLVVIGGAAGDALAARSHTPESVREVANSAGLGQQVHFLGAITDVALAAAYRAASVHVFPIREIPGDPEGFGMVAIEAAAHGLPTAAYATGGVVDAVSEGVSGRLARPEDAAALASGILDLLAEPLPAEPMRAFAEQFAWVHFGERVCEVLGSSAR